MEIYAKVLSVSVDEIFSDALTNKGFGLNSLHVDKMFCGPEGYQRTKEIADFYEQYPNPSPEQFNEFLIDQKTRWVEGDEVPPPIPGSIEGFDPRLVTSELEEKLKQMSIEKELANYSVFDVLTGRAMVDILNKNNPDFQYELVGLDEMLEDE